MASYDLGALHGEWIDVTQDVEIIFDKINNMLSRSPAPIATVWAIYAYDGFESLELSKYEDIEQIHQKALFIKAYGKWSTKLLEYYDDDFELAEEAMAENYQGKYSNELAFAIDLLDKESSDAVPEFLKLYIDYEAFKQDIFQNDYFSIEADGGAYVFSCSRSNM